MKCQVLQELHGVISQNTTFLIVTALKNSNLAKFNKVTIEESLCFKRLIKN
jgi:hypothetical protein